MVRAGDFSGRGGLSTGDASAGTGGLLTGEACAGIGGVVIRMPLRSINGLLGVRKRLDDVAVEAELPGRLGITNFASGASSESSESSSELSLELTIVVRLEGPVCTS